MEATFGGRGTKTFAQIKQQGAEAAAMQLQLSEHEPGDSNAVSQVTKSDNSQLFSLSQQVQHLTEAVAKLQLQSMSKDKEGTTSSKKPPVCWRCGNEGHLKSDCHLK